MNNVSAILLIALSLTILFAGLSLLLVRRREAPGTGPNTATRFFLVALRLVIGWHFLIEGLDKLHNPGWTSEGYLREATGPLAPTFRELAGDRLIDKLSVESDGSFPAELEIEWKAYLDDVNSYYALNAEQAKRAQTVYEQAKSSTLTWLTSTKQPVAIPSESPPPLIVPMTVPERIKEYARLKAKYIAIEEIERPQYGEDVFPRMKTAKGHMNKWRGELKRDLDKQTASFKSALRDIVLAEIAKEGLPANLRPAEPNPKNPPKDPLEPLRSVFLRLQLQEAAGEKVEISDQARKVFETTLDSQLSGDDPSDPLPYAVGRPMGAWTMLDWSDFLVKWGVTVVGALLLVGFFTRTACVLGAGYLLMFFLAMPPLPGWPESPRAEGHYLYINKNIIEMLALLVLATTRSGRWAGLDGLLYQLWPGNWRNQRASGNLEVGKPL